MKGAFLVELALFVIITIGVPLVTDIDGAHLATFYIGGLLIARNHFAPAWTAEAKLRRAEKLFMSSTHA